MDDQNRCMRCMGQKDSQQETCPACGFSEKDFVPEKHHLQPHTILKGQYLVGCALGEGGFGITYIGWDMFLHIPVAIKEYFPSGVVIRDQGQHTVSVFAGKDEESFLQGRSSFFREAQKVAKFDNNVGVVSVKNCFLENGTAYIIMEYISGINLGAYAELHGGKLTFTETLKLLRTPILTLEELHRASTWHRDISPENLMLTKDGKVKLIDFGSAMESDREKKTRVLMIRAGYSPVEMYSSTGEDGPYSDVYSMAATIYKLITGVTPPPATDRLDNDPLVPPSALGVKDISHAQEAALLKGMAVQVKSRYQTMEEFFDGLYGKNAPAPAPSQHQKRLLIGIAALLVLLLVVLLAGMIAAGGIYWLYKKATPDMIPAVTVTVAGQQLDPVAYHWQVPVAGNHLKRTYAETLSSTPTALESDFGGGTMTLRVTPADCSTEVTVKDENKQEVFSGSAQEFAAYRFTTPGSYTAKLVVNSGEGYQSEPTVSGHQTYEFTFDVTIKATVRLNTQAVTPGGVVAVKVTGQQTDTKPSLTAELPDTGFRASATGDGWVAYLAVPLETEPGSYTIKVTVDGEVQELTLNVSKSAASFRDYTSKSRLVTPYVGADDTPQEVLDLLDTASDTIYWADAGFASPFSDKVEVTLPYGLNEYVNRTQTERKNNTGTGRTSINVVLSGRCDLIAPAGGKVLLAEKLPNVGNTLVIEHGAGVKTIYYGLRRLTVEKGAIVAQGDALGTTDKATVVEVRVGKTPVEPLRILRGQCDALRSY